MRSDISGTRDEVVAELGTMFGGTPFNMGAYTVQITKGPVLANISAPGHYWYSRWRWQSAVRPVTVTIASLIAAGKIPNYQNSITGGFTPASTVRTWVNPMDLAGITPFMGAGGEREEIGLFTEAQGDYMCTTSTAALGTMRAQLEASGSIPWHFRDENTGAPVDINNYPALTLYNPNSPNAPPPGLQLLATTTNPVIIDSEHQPSLGYLLFLLTGDPYALEEMQFASTWNVLESPANVRTKWNIGFSVRAHAWALREQVRCATVTPTTVPSWLKTASYFQTMLNSNRDFMTTTFVNSTSAPFNVLNCMGDANGSPASGVVPVNVDIRGFMEEFELAVLGHVVQLGHTDWRPILNWKTVCSTARTNGTSGWNRGWPCPFSIIIRPTPTGAYVTSWAACWALNVSMQPADAALITDPNNMPNPTDLTYPSYMMGGLGIAKTIGVTGAAVGHDYIAAQIATQLSVSNTIRYKWAIASP